MKDVAAKEKCFAIVYFFTTFSQPPHSDLIHAYIAAESNNNLICFFSESHLLAFIKRVKENSDEFLLFDV